MHGLGTREGHQKQRHQGTHPRGGRREKKPYNRPTYSFNVDTLIDDLVEDTRAKLCQRRQNEHESELHSNLLTAFEDEDPQGTD